MPSNDEDGVHDNLSVLTPEEEDFPEKPVKISEIGPIDEKLYALPSKAEDFHENAEKSTKIGDQQIENQTSTGL